MTQLAVKDLEVDMMYVNPQGTRVVLDEYRDEGDTGIVLIGHSYGLGIRIHELYDNPEFLVDIVEGV